MRERERMEEEERGRRQREGRRDIWAKDEERRVEGDRMKER